MTQMYSILYTLNTFYNIQYVTFSLTLVGTEPFEAQVTLNHPKMVKKMFADTFLLKTF